MSSEGEGIMCKRMKLYENNVIKRLESTDQRYKASLHIQLRDCIYFIVL
jgi:hypothetical protein